jgi:hypothetical protein
VNANDPNVRNVELVVVATGELCEELGQVGGCAASLLIDARAAPPRVTYDRQLEQYLGVPVSWEDRELFRIAHQWSVTISRIESFVQSFPVIPAQ